MGTKPRPQPKYLPAKLRQIRQAIGASQSEMVLLLKIDMSPARISEYELGTREPSLITLLAYSYLVGIAINDMVDDSADLPQPIKIKQRRKRVLTSSLLP